MFTEDSQLHDYAERRMAAVFKHPSDGCWYVYWEEVMEHQVVLKATSGKAAHLEAMALLSLKDNDIDIEEEETK